MSVFGAILSVAKNTIFGRKRGDGKCSKCDKPVRSPGQRYCKDHHNADCRARRKREREQLKLIERLRQLVEPCSARN